MIDAKSADLHRELAAAIVARRDELLGRIRTMNPVTDPRYDAIFRGLVAIDADIHSLRGERVERGPGWWRRA